MGRDNTQGRDLAKPSPPLSRCSLVLLKELLVHVKKFPGAPVSSLKLRPLPR